LFERKKNTDYINQQLSPLETLTGDIIFPNGISYIGANKLRAFRYHRSNATVEQYYFIRHKITLEYAYLPCIYVKCGNDHKDFYPIETLKEYLVPMISDIENLFLDD
jgi:hypothetical protein